MNRLKRIFCFLVIGIVATSCTIIKPYERVYLDDPRMQMAHHAGQNFSNYVHSIREGSVPAGSAKSVGGCGCN